SPERLLRTPPEVVFIEPEPGTKPVSLQVVAPLTQPRVKLKLTDSIQHSIGGELKLSFTPNAPNSPANEVRTLDDKMIQFVDDKDGRLGRQVAVAIEKGKTESTLDMFQAGTLAGKLEFSADLTPVPRRGENYAVKVTDRFGAGATATCRVSVSEVYRASGAVSVNPQAPHIWEANIEASGGSNFDLFVTGFSTTKEIQEVKLDFAAVAGRQITPATASPPELLERFREWHLNPDSDNYGTQFDLRVDLTVQGAAQDLQSVTVTLRNTSGSSQPCEIDFRNGNTTGCRPRPPTGGLGAQAP
ncbi:MAG: hypothetical protein GY953_34315, partial [bacterium]|nr:hypothetical protein [bacterium]